MKYRILILVFILAASLPSCEESGEIVEEIFPSSMLLGSYEMIHDNASHQLIFRKNSGDFLFYDYMADSITGYLSMGGEVFHSCLGTGENGTELFITSVRDSALLVFDARSLAPIDTFAFAGMPYSVVSIDSLLFVSVQDSPDFYDFYVMGREGKEVISRFSSDCGILTHMASKDTIEIVESKELYYGYLKFNPDGTLISKTKRTDFNSNLSGRHVISAPSGKLFIADSEGVLFNSKLEMLGKLSKRSDHLYWDWEFSKNSKFIYGALNRHKKIHKYDVETMQLVDEYDTEGYPFRVFFDRDDENHLYLLVSKEPFYTTRRYYLEKISLNN